jgi:hypothetical protein
MPLGIQGISRRAWVTASLLVLTIVYAVLQVGAVRPHLPADRAVMRALDVEPEGRPASAQAFASEVVASLGVATP